MSSVKDELLSGPEFEAGLRTRREVLGAEYVDASIAGADDFMALFQKTTTELCWNFIWNREGLDRKTRSMLNIAMLAATGKSAELAIHVRGAVNNGVSVEEIQEILMQVTIYAGIPAGLESFKIAHRVLLEDGVLDGTTVAGSRG